MGETKSRSDWLILNDSFQIDDEVDGKQNRISRERKLRKIEKIKEKERLKEDLKVCREKVLDFFTKEPSFKDTIVILKFYRVRTKIKMTMLSLI